MTLPVRTVAPTGSGTLGLDALKRATNGTIEAEKMRLRKATKEFEAFFVYQMLKTMRKTIPDNSFAKDTPMSGSLGKDTFTELFDMEIARKASFGGHNSIADLLYRSMEKLIDVQFEPKAAEPTLKQLHAPSSPPQEIKGSEAVPLPRPTRRPIKISRPQTALPMQVAPRPVRTDPIMARFGRFIEEAARETKLDSALISSVIRAESNGNPGAVSRAGAKGLMQLIDATAQELKVRDPFDPRENIRAGSRYLKQMIDRFGDLKQALAAYNAGPGNVEKHGGVPPFDETQAYVRRVTGYMSESRDK